MVHNMNIILDAGELKSIPSINMSIPDYVHEFYQIVDLARPIYNDNLNPCEDFIPTREMTDAYEKLRSTETLWLRDFVYIPRSITSKEYGAIAKFMGRKPFEPAIMINISPNWKGKFEGTKIFKKAMIKGMSFTIESYLNESIGQHKRYKGYKYCLECGSDGKFLHAHCVAIINPTILKSMRTHINKGNHKQQLIKYWNKYFGEMKDNTLKGFQGCLKGEYSVQRIMLNSEQIFDDKIKYLSEENKQEGHKNKKDLGLVFGDL